VTIPVFGDAEGKHPKKSESLPSLELERGDALMLQIVEGFFKGGVSIVESKWDE